MGNDFASLHIMGVSKEETISIICPSVDSHYSLRKLNAAEKEKLLYLKQLLGDDFISSFKKGSFEVEYLNQPYLGIKSKNFFSVFSPTFEMLSLTGRTNLCFAYKNAPTVLGFSTDDNAIIRVFLYQNGEITANLCFKINSTNLPLCFDEFDNPEYKFDNTGIEKLGELFGFSVETLNNIISKQNSFSFLCKELGDLFGLPFNLTYDEIANNTKKYNAEKLN